VLDILGIAGGCQLKTRIVAVISGVVFALLLPPSPASAQTGVWHQAFERLSADSPCEAPEDETLWQESFSGQREWTPSWAQWANDGQGGWVCQRYIVWAQTQTFPSAGCILGQVLSGQDQYLNFGGGYALPTGSPVYSSADCTGYLRGTLQPAVYAPSGYDPDFLCQTAFGLPAVPIPTPDGDNVWVCSA